MVLVPANSKYPEVRSLGVVRVLYSAGNPEKPDKTKRYMIFVYIQLS